MRLPNQLSRKRFWTREKVLDALIKAAAEIRGPLPTSHKTWGIIKRGRYDLPPPTRIYEFFHSFPQAWVAAGAGDRVSLSFAKWTEADDGYLLDYAGQYTLKLIARHLRRTCPSVRSRLGRWYKIQSRHNQGYLSAAELAKEYKCPYHRILGALRLGAIKGRFDKKRTRWNIDLIDLTAEALMILTAPKQTYKSREADLGDYYQRHGLKRQNINGKVMIVSV